MREMPNDEDAAEAGRRRDEPVNDDGARGQEPVMPLMLLPRPGLAGEQYILIGRKVALGLEQPRDGPPCYFLRDQTGFRRRPDRTFPLTEEGWVDAWGVFAAAEPKQAEASIKRAQVERLREMERAEGARREAALVAARQSLDDIPMFLSVPGTLIGGYNHEPLTVGCSYHVIFSHTAVLIFDPVTVEEVAASPYHDVLSVRVDGPGAITTGGGFIGGGFGVAGAAEGMVVASVLNALTRKTTIQTIMEVQDRDRDLIFFSDTITPQDLRLRLMPVEAKLRASAVTVASANGVGDPLDRLEKLSRLHQQGIVTDDEFESAKQAILRRL